jgi:ubiquinone/menaquinone biosynthesis C-methylase UbiE
MCILGLALRRRNPILLMVGVLVSTIHLKEIYYEQNPKEKNMSNVSSEFEALKARLKATWMAGEFGQFAKYNELGAEQFIARRDIRPGIRVLDLACGTGNLAISAAKADAFVTGVDIAPNWLEQARMRAKRESLNIQFDEGDAEQLPYPNSSFDLIVSMFGVMFAPRPESAVAEMLRVCRPGGQIAMANWTPGGFTGQLMKIMSAHIPPPSSLPSPLLWGDEAIVSERLREGITNLQTVRVKVSFRYPFSVPETVEFFRATYGPTQRTFAALSEDKQEALRRDLENLLSQHNRAADGATEFESEYLEVVATRV